MTEPQDPIDPRIADYIRTRANITLPDGLMNRAFDRMPAESARPGASNFGRAAYGALATAVALLAVVFAFGVGMRPPTDQRPSATAAGVADPLASPSPSVEATALQDVGEVPVTVEGFPVLSVADAAQLRANGDLDGQAVAIAGYFSWAAFPCPEPAGYYSVFEASCHFVAFGDTVELGRICTGLSNGGVSCGTNGLPGVRLSPYRVEETAGETLLVPAIAPELVHVVLIAHTDDPRRWLCIDENDCRDALVIDRVAWADGHLVPLTTPEVRDWETNTNIQPRIEIQQLQPFLSSGQTLLTAVPLFASDVSYVDPRFNLNAKNIVWLVRSVGPPAGVTRALTVTLIDDATGAVLASRPLTDPTFQPARLWLRATLERIRESFAPDNQEPFYRLTQDGQVLAEGRVSGGGVSNRDRTIYHSGAPHVLEPGTYELFSWWANRDGTPVGEERTCTIGIVVDARDELYLSADFEKNGPCQINPFPDEELTNV